MPQKSAFEVRYKAFEDQFRGSLELIRSRLYVYLPLLEQADGSPPNARKALDLGSGRGEWLHLLTENGWEATGVDSNAGMADAAREKGTVTIEGDALEFLRSQ